MNLYHRRQQRCHRGSPCGRAAPRAVRFAYGLLDIEGGCLQHALNYIGAIEAIAELRDWVEIRRAVVAVIDMPANQFVTARRGIVVALRRPRDPTLAVGMDKERQ